MLTYTNHLKRLVLPEYGRNIQNMVDHCTTIADREERNRCAEAIIEAMLTLFPSQGDAVEYRRKLWDHLLIMSDFTLDVDFPFEHVAPETFDGGPAPFRPSAPAACRSVTTAATSRGSSRRLSTWRRARHAMP